MISSWWRINCNILFILWCRGQRRPYYRAGSEWVWNKGCGGNGSGFFRATVLRCCSYYQLWDCGFSKEVPYFSWLLTTNQRPPFSVFNLSGLSLSLPPCSLHSRLLYVPMSICLMAWDGVCYRACLYWLWQMGMQLLRLWQSSPPLGPTASVCSFTLALIFHCEPCTPPPAQLISRNYCAPGSPSLSFMHLFDFAPLPGWHVWIWVLAFSPFMHVTNCLSKLILFHFYKSMYMCECVDCKREWSITSSQQDPIWLLFRIIIIEGKAVWLFSQSSLQRWIIQGKPNMVPETIYDVLLDFLSF